MGITVIGDKIKLYRLLSRIISRTRHRAARGAKAHQLCRTAENPYSSFDLFTKPPCVARRSLDTGSSTLLSCGNSK